MRAPKFTQSRANLLNRTWAALSALAEPVYESRVIQDEAAKARRLRATFFEICFDLAHEGVHHHAGNV